MNRTVKELREIAKSLGIKGYYKMRKNDLVETIEKIKEKNSVVFNPENTAISKGNSYRATVVSNEVWDKKKILDYGLGVGRNVAYMLIQVSNI